MKNSFKDRMKKYKTGLKMDEKLLCDKAKLSYNLRNCIEVRLGEKKIVDFYLKMARTMVKHFSGSERISQENILYDLYLTDIA